MTVRVPGQKLQRGVSPRRRCHPALRPIAALIAYWLAPAGTLALASLEVRAQTACGTIASGTYTALSCTPASGNAVMETVSGTTFNTSAGASLRAAAKAANASVTLTGTTITNSTATAASGVASQVSIGPGDASVTFNGGTSAITMQGAGVDGVAITNSTAGSSAITVNAGTTLNITNLVGGNEHDGFDVNATGGGNASIIHNGSGVISTAGGNGLWVKAAGAGDINVQVGSGVTLNVDNTNGIADPADPGESNGPSNHAGIRTRTAGSGVTTVNNAAAINANAMNAVGIYTDGGTGATSVSNAGAIVTNGENGFGIRSAAGGGPIEISNAGVLPPPGRMPMASISVPAPGPAASR